jgi:polygalacturonase
MDEMRPRVVYVSNSKDVLLSGGSLINSPFWTTHFYKCENVKLLNLYIYSPYQPVKAPSTDAVDIDACSNVLIKNCYMSVNDDAVALKGGKGPYADKDENNGGNRNIIIEDCTYGFCHSALTCGSESIHNRNILFRRCTVNQAQRILWLKMRPDTPQNYEYISVEDITGNANTFIDINPWTQFFDLKGQPQPYSSAKNITVRNCNIECDRFINIKQSEQYTLSDFTLENLNITTSAKPNGAFDFIRNLRSKDITVNNRKLILHSQTVSNETTKPWTRWWWFGNAVTEKDITAALETYQKAGLGGVEITPIYGVKGEEQYFIEYLSPAWMEKLVYTLNEAKRLGLGVDMEKWWNAPAPVVKVWLLTTFRPKPWKTI